MIGVMVLMQTTLSCRWRYVLYDGYLVSEDSSCSVYQKFYSTFSYCEKSPAGGNYNNRRLIDTRPRYPRVVRASSEEARIRNIMNFYYHRCCQVIN